MKTPEKKLRSVEHSHALGDDKIQTPGGGHVSKRLWEGKIGERGEFHVEKDTQGQTVSIEGWLQNRPGYRPQSDTAVQKQFRKEHQLNQSQDAFHVIAYRHGGPSTGSHSMETVKSNLVAADGLINKSYHASFENQITKKLDEGTNLYCKATIHYKVGSESKDSATVERISYRYFVKGQSGQPEPHTVTAYVVKVDKTPGVAENRGKQTERKTAASVLKQNDAADFYSNKLNERKPAAGVLKQNDAADFYSNNLNKRKIRYTN